MKDIREIVEQNGSLPGLEWNNLARDVTQKLAISEEKARGTSVTALRNIAFVYLNWNVIVIH